MIWKSFSIPFTGTNYKSFNITKAGNNLILSLVDKIIGLDKSLQVLSTELVKPPYDSYTWYPSESDSNKGWMLWHNMLYKVPNLKDFSTWIRHKSLIGHRAFVTENAVISFDKSGLSGIYIDSDLNESRFDFTSYPVLTTKLIHTSHGNTFALVGDSLFVGLRDGFKNSSEHFKNTETPANGVLELNLKTNKVTDHSYNLDGTNATGNLKTASSVKITFNQNTLYACTEQWVYKKQVTDTTWTKVQQAWHGSDVFVLNKDEVLITTRSGLYIYKDNYLYKQASLPEKFTVRSAVKVDNTLIVSDIVNGKPSILYTESVYVKEPEAVSAQYLNIPNPTSSITLGNAEVIASDKSLYKVTSDTKELITTFNEKVLAISFYSSDTLLVAKESTLSLFNLNTKVETNIFTYATSKEASVSTDGSKISLIVDDRLVVLNSSYTVDYELKEVDTFIKDSLFLNNKLYVVGWFNGRNKGVPVQFSLFREYNLTNFTFRKLWETDPNKLDADMADCRLYKVYQHVGKIYVLGESAGGNSQFRWNGLDLKTSTINNGEDWWTHAVQTKSNHITYVGMIDPVTFKVVRGQFVLTRLADMQGNTHRANSLYVDSTGVYIGGLAAAYIFNRDVAGILNQQSAIYRGGDASFLKLTTDLTGGRLSWFTSGNAKKVISYTPKYAVVSTDNVGDMITNKGTCDKSIADNTYLISW